MRGFETFTLVEKVRLPACGIRTYLKLQHVVFPGDFLHAVEQHFPDAMTSDVFRHEHFLDFAYRPAVVQQVLDVTAHEANRNVSRKGHEVNVFWLRRILFEYGAKHVVAGCGRAELSHKTAYRFEIFECGRPDLYRFQWFGFAQIYEIDRKIR